jgi:predicted pyridoxine 5'-phosphate oxidase superfamily flavin-nucleotide-binding protein
MGWKDHEGTTPQGEETETMVLITEEMREVFEKIKVFSVGTAAEDGTPNVAPIASVKFTDGDEIWLGDNYMKKTLANVRANPKLAMYAWDPDSKKCYQVKGRVEVRTEGPAYEQMKAMLKAKNEAYPAKSVLVLRVEEIYTCAPGPGAGDRVA